MRNYPVWPADLIAGVAVFIFLLWLTSLIVTFAMAQSLLLGGILHGPEEGIVDRIRAGSWFGAWLFAENGRVEIERAARTAAST